MTYPSSEKKQIGLILFVAMFIAGSVGQNTARSQSPILRTSRPRLFFTAERLERLHQRIGEQPLFNGAWNKMRGRANRLLEEKLVSKEYAEGGTGQHGNYGRPSSQIADMAGTLGLAYLITGEERYAKKLRDALIYYGGLSRWAGDAHNDPPWHSELNTARFCYGYAVGYDSIYDSLSVDERRTIAEAMVRLGILPTLDDWILGEKRIHALDSMGHNWWSVCVSMAGLAALSLVGDEPRAELWTRRVSEALPEWFAYQGNVLQNKTANFDEKGAFYEGVNYANYALSEYLLFRLAFTNVFGKSSAPDIPVLKTAGDFFIQTCYPTSDGILSVNFGDSSLHSTGARTLRLLLANIVPIQGWTIRWGWFTTICIRAGLLGITFRLRCSIQTSAGRSCARRGPTTQLCWRSSRASRGTTPIRTPVLSFCFMRVNH
jgi:hypothetical protein